MTSKNLNKYNIFSPKNLHRRKSCLKFALAKQRLSYGVMVTQQILVLFFLVRIRVAQLKSRALRSAAFFIRSAAFCFWINPDHYN